MISFVALQPGCRKAGDGPITGMFRTLSSCNFPHTPFHNYVYCREEGVMFGYVLVHMPSGQANRRCPAP